ncbi:MAG: hypothetical protein R3F21_01575 [Myxococcota bacterium]
MNPTPFDGRRRSRRAPRPPRRRPIVLALLAALVFAASGIAHGAANSDGRFQRRESLHFALDQNVGFDEYSGVRGSRQFEQNVLRELEGAYDRLDALLGLRPGRKLVVTVWAPDLFDERFAGLFRFPAAGFYGGSIQIRGGQRLDEALVRVLHHELVHAALDAAAPNLVLPAWLNEGLAEWFEARSVGKRSLSGGERALLERVARAGGLASLAELSRPSFGGLPAQTASLAYLEAYAFIDFLAGREGERGLAELCGAILQSRSIERGLRRVHRQDLAQLEQAFRRSLGAP